MKEDKIPSIFFPTAATLIDPSVQQNAGEWQGVFKNMPASLCQKNKLRPKEASGNSSVVQPLRHISWLKMPPS